MPPSGSRARSPERRRVRALGRRGEALAALYLRLSGYRILARGVRTPVGEVDLIAMRKDMVVFVEVKARAASGQQAPALDAVNTRRIGRAAAWYLARHPALAGREMRFDVIFLAPFSWPRHVRAAFDYEEQ